MAILIVFGGLPGTGKSTLAKAIAQERGAVYLRIDTIEQALRDAAVLEGDVGAAGYLVGYALAQSNLRLGRDVVADCVNPLGITRRAWRDTAAKAASNVVEIEVVCSDPAEHRHRIESRSVDVAGLKLPRWDEIHSSGYERWLEPHAVIDTANRSVEDALRALRDVL
ncbi:MAG TPA: AAA family ATPase [Rhizomicrobium sp.]|jgi:predicted kinase